MGLFSGGNSKSSTTVINETLNAGFSELGGGNATAIQGDGNTVTVTDLGTIDRAFSFAERTNNDAIAVVSDVAENAGKQTSEAVAAVSQSVRTGAENIVNQLGTYGAVIAAGFLLVKLLGK